MHLEYLVDVEEMPIKEYLMFLGLSRRLARKIKLYGKMYINHQEAFNYYLVKKGDLLTIEFDEVLNEKIVSNQSNLEILYEDDDLMVVNKPHDLAIQPSKRHQEDNLISRIKAFFINQEITSNIHIVNRLDYATSGLVLVAKNGYIHHQLTSKNHVYKKYQALVVGQLIEKEGTINLPIARLVDEEIKRGVSEAGKSAITHYRVLVEYENTSLLELVLETGRTHQIRVHMSHIGHPLLGDKLYGTEEKRLYLDCYYMEFIHPQTNKKLTFSKEVKWNV